MSILKKFLAVLLILPSYIAYSQLLLDNLTAFNHGFGKKFSFPFEMRENCTNSTVLLRIDVIDSKVKSLRFSDNANPYMRKELEKITADLPLHILENYAKGKSKKDYTFLVPVFLVNKLNQCEGKSSDPWDPSGFTFFGGERMSETNLMLDPVVINAYWT